MSGDEEEFLTAKHQLINIIKKIGYLDLNLTFLEGNSILDNGRGQRYHLAKLQTTKTQPLWEDRCFPQTFEGGFSTW